MRDLGLADRIRAKGVRVIEVAGWQTRGNDGGGYPTFRPIGAVHHHTAGSSRGATPSLSTNIYGRPDVPGPLAQVMQSREPDGRDIAYVIASGKANHGGVGTWTGPAGTMDSNYESMGLEVEHTGFGPVPAGRHEISARIIAAMLEAPGSSRNAGMCCEHFEYARPLGRKVDFRELDPYTAATFRQRVGQWIGRTTSTPPEEDDFVDKKTFMAWFNEAIDNHAQIHGIAGGPRPWYGRTIEWIYKGARDAIATRALVTNMAQKINALGDIDEAEVARQVLEGFDPTAIAAAIPDDIAERVADELHSRLAG